MNRLSTTALLAAAAALIISAGLLNRTPAMTKRSRTRAVQNSASPAYRQPAPVTTVALAGFRCLAADILWLRASDLQEEGRYFELVQLADWITTLEPHFKEVWSVNAWNMAYNISIMMPDNRERWRWVKNGIQLLRDHGIPHNHDNPYLYTELGFIFSDKIGSSSDPSTQYFKREWAKEMIELLGESGYPDYSEIERSPATLERMRSYKLDPDTMRKIDRTYGPLDWRVPHTHSLYWAYLGNTATGTNIHDTVCERMIYQSMTAIFDTGKLTYNKDADIFVTSCNFEILPKVIATFEDALTHAENDLPAEAYANFLASATRTLKFYHHDIQAREMFDKLKSRFPSPATELDFEAFTQHASPTMPQILSPREEIRQ